LGASNLIPARVDGAGDLSRLRASGLARPRPRRDLVHPAGGADLAGDCLGLRAVRIDAGGDVAPVRDQARDHRRRRAGDLALAKTAVKEWLLAAVGALVLVLYAAGFNEIVMLLGSGLLVMAARPGWRLQRPPRVLALVPMVGAPALPAVAGAAVDPVSPFLVFLKLGAVRYGGGSVLLAFLRGVFCRAPRAARRPAAALRGPRGSAR